MLKINIPKLKVALFERNIVRMYTQNSTGNIRITVPKFVMYNEKLEIGVNRNASYSPVATLPIIILEYCCNAIMCMMPAKYAAVYVVASWDLKIYIGVRRIIKKTTN
jgi:hypothetical protein